jgi:fatty-acyl-CoA synthase
VGVCEQLDQWAQRQPVAPALRDDERSVTYGALAREITGVADGLREQHGIGRGDRVAYLGLNRVELLVTLFACARIGAAMVPVNWRLTPHEIGFVLDDSGASLLVGDVDLLAGIDHPGVDRRALVDPGAAGGADGAGDGGCDDDVALIVYTSGTTGAPKGAMLSQRALRANARNAVAMFGLSADDQVLTALPMFHVGGLNIQTTPALLSGASVTLHARFDPGRWLAEVASTRPTLSLLVPATMAAVQAHPDWESTDLSSLRMLGTGSTFVPVPLIEAFHQRGVPVGQVYGATETGPIAVCQNAVDALAAPGATGRPAATCELRIVDAADVDVVDGERGELLVRGDHVFTGYWNQPDATAAVMIDGWYRTGDVGEIGADGQVRIADRVKDMIITGGENVYPAELEHVLVELPGVADAAVVGVPDERWGEAAVAVVVRRNDDLTVDDVMAAFDGRLARYKHPRRVEFVDALPRNVMGKVLKAELRRSLA